MQRFIRQNMLIITWLGGIGIPLAILFAGWAINSKIESTKLASESSKLDSEYVRLAIGILNKEKAPGTTNTAPSSHEEALKKWSLRLLDKRSPESFNEEEKKALLSIPGLLDPVRETRSVDPKVEGDGCKVLEAGNALYIAGKHAEAIQAYLNVQDFDRAGQGLCVASIYATIGTIYRLKADTVEQSNAGEAARLLRLANEFNRAFANALICQRGNCENAITLWRDWKLNQRL